MKGQEEINYKSEDNAEMIVKTVFYAYINNQHRGKVETSKARALMFK